MQHVKRADEVPAVEVKAGIDTKQQVLISGEEAPHFALRRFTLGPGGSMPRHTNSVEHEQYVLAGSARITIGDASYDVSAGDVVFIPAGVPHDYRTTGDAPFVFLCAVPNAQDVIELEN